MSTYEYVETAIWSDPTFHDLSASAKVLYFWSFTNPRCNLAGLYKVPAAMMSVETGLSKKVVERALEELAEAHLVHHAEPLVWVRARVKYLHTHNASVAKSIRKALSNLDEKHDLVQAFLFTYQNIDWLVDDLGGFAHPTSNPLLRVRTCTPTRGRGKSSNGVVL